MSYAHSSFALRVVLVVATLLAPPSSSAAALVADPPAAVLVLVRLASAGPDALREQSFADELAIAMDGVTVAEVSLGPSFAAARLSTQIDLVRPAIVSHRAVAAVWVARDNDLALLHVVAVDTGRALVRLLEVRADSRWQERLAFAARELVGAAYMFAPASVTTPAVRAAVDSVRDAVATESVPSKPAAPQAIVVGVAGRSGFVRQVGPATSAAALLAVETLLPVGITAELGFEPSLSAGGTSAGATLRGFGLGLALRAIRGWQSGPFTIGPALGAYVEWRNTTFMFPSMESETRTDFIAGATGGMRFNYDSPLGLWAGIEVAIPFAQRAYVRSSDGRIVSQTGRAGGALELGVRIPVGW